MRDYKEFRQVIKNIKRVPWFYEGTSTLFSIFIEIKKNVKFVAGKVLDVGCGSKPYKHLFYDASQYIGVDKILQKNAIDIQTDCINLPFRNSQFDAVLLLEVLEHSPDPKQVLREIFRVMRDGAFLLISVPQTVRIHGAPHDYYRYTFFGLRYVLESGGFELIYIKERGGFFMSWFQELAFLLSEAGRRINILRPGMQLIGAIAQITGLGLDKLFYWPDHTLGYFCVAKKVRKE